MAWIYLKNRVGLRAVFSRQRLIALVTFLSGLYFFLEYVLPEKIGAFKLGLYHGHVSRGFVVIGTMAIGLGVINIVRVHGGAVLKGKKGWGNSLALLVGLLVMFAVEGGDFLSSISRVNDWKRIADLREFSARVKSDYLEKDIPAAGRIEKLVQTLDRAVDRSKSGQGFLAADNSSGVRPELKDQYLAALASTRSRAISLSEVYHVLEKENLAKLPLKDELTGYNKLAQLHQELDAEIIKSTAIGDSLSKANYEQSVLPKAVSLLQNSFFFPLGAAMFSLLAFYIATAAYRSFRIRSAEAFIMMLAAVVVTLGQIPQGPIYISEDLPLVRLWLLNNLSTPAFRAIYFGAALAGLAMAVRMWLSLEKSPLATEDVE